MTETVLRISAARLLEDFSLEMTGDRAVTWHSEDRVIRDGNQTIVFA